MTIFVVKYLCVQKHYNKDNISSIFFWGFIIFHIQKILRIYIHSFFYTITKNFFHTRVHARCLQQAVVRVFFLAAAAAASEVICITS